MLIFLIIPICLAALFGFSSAASAASLSMEPRRGAVDLGERTRILVEAEGPESARWQLQSAPFPYEGFQNEGAPRNLETTEIVIGPMRNTRYRVLLLDGEEVLERTKARIVWVRPKNSLRTRWNRPYLYTRGWTEIDGYFGQFFRDLPRRQRQIYLYSRCRGGPWRLQKRSPLRGVQLGDRFRIDWELSRSLRCRGSLSYWTVGMLLFPGTLPSGDEGLGRPRLRLAEIKRATELLGQRYIPPRDMKKYFGASS